MKTKKTLGLFAVALTALASVFPGAAKADGDIRSITFNGNPLGEVGVVEDLSKPLVAGDKVQFKIRLANREWSKTDADSTYLNPWQLRSLPGISIGENALPQVGLRVSGGLRYADIVRIDDSEKHHTDLICQYTVQAGDFALPLKLANSKGTAPAMEGDPDEPAETPDKSNYYLTSQNIWGFFPKFPTDNNTTNRLEFYFGPEVLGFAEYPGANLYKDAEVRDYDLSKANIQIKAIDFDGTYAAADGSVWRSIAAGTTTATPAVPRLSIPGGASGSYKYYVWTKDQSIAEVENGSDYVFKDGVTRKVAVVNVVKDDELVPFTIRAKVGQVGKTTEVYMSDTPTNIYNRAGTLVTNFTTRVISIVEPPPPSIKVVLDPVSGIVSSSTNNYLSVATLDVELSEPWTEDVTVLLTPSMKSGSGADPFTFIGMSTAMSGAEYYDGQVQTLVVKAGNTKASDAGTMLYVYANRANEDTAKGLRFTPTIDPASANRAAAEAFFTGELTPATLQVNAGKPVITAPAEGQEYFNIPANTLTDFTITVADAMWDLHGKTPTDGKYTVYIDYNGSGTYEAISNLTANASGEITFQYRYIVGGRDYNSKIYVVNQDDVSSGKENARAFTVHVNVAKKVEVTSDHDKKTYCEGETAELSFKFTEAFDYATDGFIFLEPADDNSRDLVDCDEFSYGIPISVGATVPAQSAHLLLKDGWKNCAFKYNVVVRSTNDATDDTNIISVWGSDGITLYSTNAAPSILSVSMNNTPAYSNGETLTARAAVGVQNMFEVAAWDESSDIDLEDANFETVVKFWENGAVAKTEVLHGNPYGQQIPYTFSTGGDGVKNKVTVHVYDKDMTAAERLVVDKNPFTVFVETADAPAISLSPYNSSTYFLESDTGNTKGRIYVDLTVPPTGLGTGHITVHLDVERVGADDGNYTLPVLSTYDLEFKNNISRQSFFLAELDGTPMSASKGFRIRASVVETTKSPDDSKTWAEYYEPCSDFFIFVENENPKIGPGVVATNEVPVAINVPYSITWTASDISVDASALTVTWTYNGGSETTVENMDGKTGTKQVTFTSAGSKTVSLMVKDKDGGLDTREYFFYVAPSKVLEIYPRQPNRLTGKADGVSKFSKKFTNASGIGDGRVWADGANAPTEISGFVHKWSYSPEDLKTTVYARGYKYDPLTGLPEVDNGSLTPGKDFAIDANGSAWKSGDYYTYGDLDRKDSFFYCWILNSGDEGGYEGTHLAGVQPEVGISSEGRQEVTLPEFDDSATTYAPTVLEAIFSVEYLASDNLGDINQDGIPDVYAAVTTWRGGTLVEAAGYSMDDEDPGDLKRLGNWNDDTIGTQSGAEIGDWLPSASSSGTSLIPNMINWSTAGGKFTAYMEVRGFDDNINYRIGNSGLNRNVRGRWVSDPNFSKAEWISVAYHNPACGVDLATSTNWVEDVAVVSNYVLTTENSWIPENRTDPTVDDTDEDGFPDGYEYYFWYSAAVGELDAKGNWVRLSGSKFSLDDIATGVEMTPDEVAAAFNPTVAYGGRADLRDTDNDGLTDLEEFSMGTNPINWDSDGDGLSDFWEIMNGMNPLENSNVEGAAMNADGDFMARWDSEKAYAIATFTMPDKSVREYAIPGNYKKYFNITDEKTGAAELTEDAMTNQFVAISVFRYGSASTGVCVPRFRGGEVENTVDNFGVPTAALPLDPLVWELGDATNEDVKITVKLEQKIALVHDQVNAQFGFDPRTGWNNKDDYVSERWKPTTKGSQNQGEAGKAANTVKYTALDEYLLLKYRYETNKESPDKLLDYHILKDGKPVPYATDVDDILWNGSPVRRCGEVFLYGTTAPNIEFSNPDWVVATTTMGDATFASALHGADTDLDGVPDGWELYVKHNPNWGATDDTKDTDGDKLNLVAEYAGTDSCNAYTNCPSIYENHPGLKTGWYNKFFPTNPDDKDTDGDGIADDKEGASWESAYCYASRASGDAGMEVGVKHTFTFIYGSNEGKPEGDDGSVCIRGGGLNPCSVDTDGDCLPDAWEHDFAGVVFGPSGTSSISLDAGTMDLIRRADGLVNGREAVGYYITGGMDGTFGCRDEGTFTGDAYTNPSFVDPATGTVRDFDFDHDGLQNFQEYLVQSLRHLRYDDSSTPLMGQWMPSGDVGSLTYVGFIPMNIMDGETFYASAKKAGFAATGAWDFHKLGYFARPTHEWDKAALNTKTANGGSNYDEKGYRFMYRPEALAGEDPATGYCSTDPRLWDSDCDGMDDYYELFHGLNPLLGHVEGGSFEVTYDLVARAYGGKVCNWYNAWTGWPMQPPASPVYDAVKYPWMMGTPSADADGDGLRNIEEAILSNMTSPRPTHTDPTPLWMTDSSSVNGSSYVAQYYRMDCDAFVPDMVNYPWQANLGGEMGWMFDFEENEGYDTDHDGIRDGEELVMSSTPVTDPLDSTDPDRRQALWLPGDQSAAVSYNCAPNNALNVNYDFFRQFTVEAWIRPACVTREQVILERAVSYDGSTLSNGVNQVRANFRLGIREDGRLYGMYDSSDAVASGTQLKSAIVNGVVPEIDVWTHVALTFDGKQLALYVNGRQSDTVTSGLPPANGIVAVTQQPTSGKGTFPYRSSYYTCANSAIVVGATALDLNGINLSADTTWSSYGSFFEGYVDEVRAWDGAQSADAIASNYKRRFSLEDVEDFRGEVYTAWTALDGNGDGEIHTRNDNDGAKMLPVELLVHYSFQNLPGGVMDIDTHWEPAGFTKNVLDQVRVCGAPMPGGLACGWWSTLPVASEVYVNRTWVPWIQNTCAHLAPLDGSTVDSRYWGTLLAGDTLPSEVGVKEYDFPNVMNPYSLYNFGYAATFNANHRWLRANDDDSFADLYMRHSFDSRVASVGSTDMLPLGGAFAKRCEEMWDGKGAADAWESTGFDFDGDGIPDWWYDVAVANYGVAAGDEITWDTLVDYNGALVTAREAYLRDLVSGMLPSDDGSRNIDDAFVSAIDADGDGLPDWWEKLNGITKQEGQDDADFDGLNNRAEYLIAESFGGFADLVDPKYKISPTKISSFASDGQLVPDYFLRVGRLYLGEMFSDHDFMEDGWEDSYSSAFVARSNYDPFADNDDDGWSNFAECRAGTDPTRVGISSIDSTDLPEHPVPVIRAKVSYFGSDTLQYPVVVKAWSDKTSGIGMPDAIWTVGGTAAKSEGSSGDDSAQTAGVQHEKILGKNSNSVVALHLGPGQVEPGTVAVQLKDPTYEILTVTRVDGVVRSMRYSYGTYASAQWVPAGQDVFGDDGKGTLVVSGSMDNSGEPIACGAIDYQTGEATLDLTKFQGWINSQISEETNDTTTKTVSRLTYEYKSYVKVLWRSRTVSSASSATFYLSDADVSSSAAPSRGYVREGLNTFTAFLDVNGDGKYTPGEPFGANVGVDVGWASAEVDIELTDTNASVARYDIAGAFSAGSFEGANEQTDRGVKGSYDANYAAFYVGTNALSSGATRVRIVRTALNGETANVNGVVFDKVMDLSGHPTLTEADILSKSKADLDWGTLLQAWKDSHSGSANMTPLTKVAYRVVLGDGSVEMAEMNNNIAAFFVNSFEYGASQTPTVPDANQSQHVYSARPTFRWKHEPLDATGKRIKDYPAFQCRVYDSTGAKIWESDVLKAPTRGSDGYYMWTAPISVGMATKEGKVFEAKKNYKWSVSMLDAKFTTFGRNEVKTDFSLRTTGNAADDAGYGSLAVAVKYFGPLIEEGLSTTPANSVNLIHVQAFTNPDFTGDPAGETYVTNIATLASSTEVKVNAVIAGLPQGTYYVRAFIDSDADFAHADWESWGYACNVGASVADIYTPRAFSVSSKADVATAVVYIEDADTDGDGLPDAWEMLTNGSLGAAGPASGDSYYTKVNPQLVDVVNAGSIASVEGLTAEDLAVWPLLSSVLGKDVSSQSSLAGALLLGGSATVTDADVEIVSFSLTDGIELSAETETKRIGGGASLSAVAAPAAVTVTWELLYAPTLDVEFTVVETGTVTLGGTDSARKTVSLDGARSSATYSEKSGFFKVRVTRVSK